MAKILVVDDDLGVRNLLNDFLTMKGYQVVLAIDGVDALSVVTNDHFDVIITDLDMPNMNGYELLKRVKLTLNLSVPILLMSGLTSQEQEDQKDELLQNGFIVGFFDKPLDLNSLAQAIEKI